MKNRLYVTALVAAAVLLSGCSTPVVTTAPVTTTAAPESTPASVSVIQPVLGGEIEKLSADILAAGGLAAIGTAESKNTQLALDKAKVNGRKELKRMLNARVEALAKAFSEETGVPYESLLLAGFNNTTKALSGQIAGSIAQTLKYETIGDTSTAYAIMVLDPKAIVSQLAKEKELYSRLQPTKAFGELNREAKAYEAFTAAKK